MSDAKKSTAVFVILAALILSICLMLTACAEGGNVEDSSSGNGGVVNSVISKVESMLDPSKDDSSAGNGGASEDLETGSSRQDTEPSAR